jgi:hypothetical protein
MRNGTDLDKIASFFTFPCFRFMGFFVMEYNVVVLIIHNISYTAISIKVLTETIVKCTIWALNLKHICYRYHVGSHRQQKSNGTNFIGLIQGI